MKPSPAQKFSTLLSLFLLSAATLAFEISLTRLFSVAQFYHFAFMIVSVALLGYGASGAALTVLPALQRGAPQVRLSQFSLAAGASILAAYLLTNWLPFDSYSLAWDRRQALILALHYLALSAPFFFSGLALGYLLTAFPQAAGGTYAVNLLGSALGCALALAAPAFVWGDGMVVLSTALAALAAIIALSRVGPLQQPMIFAGALALLIFSLFDLGSRLAGKPGFALLELHLSPYKSLSYVLQQPGAEVLYRGWDAASRVDVARSPGLHSIPGLSYRYLLPLPSMDGLMVDGDDLNPLAEPATDPAFTAYLPQAVSFQLRPAADSLVLSARGGLDVLTALTLGARHVTAVELNPLIVEAGPIYDDPRVKVFVESDRSYLRRTADEFDVIVLALTSSFHPVRSGAYALAEDYRYTVESFQEALAHLSPDGLLTATRWLQDPPSEDLRLFALGVTALELADGEPRAQIVALRGYNTATVLLKNGAFTPDELSVVRAFAAERAFDLSYAPDIRPEETNRYNLLPESKYYQTYLALLESHPRQAFYEAYEYDVRPPTDDHPFFGHYFKWAQTPQVLADMGRTWQPFGGAGYFVILALLALALLLAISLILLPVVIWKRRNRGVASASPFLKRNLVYFGLLGFAFLLVEIPLLQGFILYLGQPAYAAAMVLFSLLFFSGLGSRSSHRIPLRLSLPMLVILILFAPYLLQRLFAATLGLPLIARLGLTALSLAPLGFLMGIPFPAGMRLLTREPALDLDPDKQSDGAPRADIPWVWAVNGAASVISSILAALLALTFGFNFALRVGALCYAGAWLTARLMARLTE